MVIPFSIKKDTLDSGSGIVSTGIIFTNKLIEPRLRSKMLTEHVNHIIKGFCTLSPGKDTGNNISCINRLSLAKLICDDGAVLLHLIELSQLSFYLLGKGGNGTYLTETNLPVFNGRTVHLLNGLLIFLGENFGGFTGGDAINLTESVNERYLLKANEGVITKTHKGIKVIQNELHLLLGDVALSGQLFSSGAGPLVIEHLFPDNQIEEIGKTNTLCLIQNVNTGHAGIIPVTELVASFNFRKGPASLTVREKLGNPVTQTEDCSLGQSTELSILKDTFCTEILLLLQEPEFVLGISNRKGRNVYNPGILRDGEFGIPKGIQVFCREAADWYESGVTLRVYLVSLEALESLHSLNDFTGDHFRINDNPVTNAKLFRSKHLDDMILTVLSGYLLRGRREMPNHLGGTERLLVGHLSQIIYSLDCLLTFRFLFYLVLYRGNLPVETANKSGRITRYITAICIAVLVSLRSKDIVVDAQVLGSLDTSFINASLATGDDFLDTNTLLKEILYNLSNKAVIIFLGMREVVYAITGNVEGNTLRYNTVVPSYQGFKQGLANLLGRLTEEGSTGIFDASSLLCKLFTCG